MEVMSIKFEDLPIVQGQISLDNIGYDQPVVISRSEMILGHSWKLNELAIQRRSVTLNAEIVQVDMPEKNQIVLIFKKKK